MSIRTQTQIIPYENAEQAAVVQWWRAQYPKKDKLFFAIPNGELRAKATAAKLEKQGVKSGVADLFLAIAIGGYHGFFLEMKRRKGGRQAESQKGFQRLVEAEGYLYFVAYGAGEAIEKLKAYMAGEIQINPNWKRPQARPMPSRVRCDIPMPDEDGPEYITVSEAIRILPLSHATVYSLLKHGRLRGVLVGGKWRVLRASAIEYLKECVR